MEIQSIEIDENLTEIKSKCICGKEYGSFFYKEETGIHRRKCGKCGRIVKLERQKPFGANLKWKKKNY